MWLWPRSGKTGGYAAFRVFSEKFLKVSGNFFRFPDFRNFFSVICNPEYAIMYLQTDRGVSELRSVALGYLNRVL